MYICTKRGKLVRRGETAPLRSWLGHGWGHQDTRGGCGRARGGKCPSLGYFNPVWLKKSWCHLLCLTQCHWERHPAQPACGPRETELLERAKPQQHQGAQFPSFIPGPREILVTSKSCGHLKMMQETSPPSLVLRFKSRSSGFGGGGKAGFALKTERIWTSRSTLSIFLSFQVLLKPSESEGVGAAPGPADKHPVSSPSALSPAEMHLQPSSIPSMMVVFPSLAAKLHHRDSLFSIQVRDALI